MHLSASQLGEAANQKREFLFLLWRPFFKNNYRSEEWQVNYKMKQESSEVGTEIRNVGRKLMRTGRQKQGERR